MIKETNAIFAGELSGHLFFNDVYYGYDDALYAAVRLIQIMQEEKCALSYIYEALPKTFSSREIKIPCDDALKFKRIQTIADLVKRDHLPHSLVDGVRVSYPHGWWLVRASNTQPFLVGRVEGKTQEAHTELLAEFRRYIDFEEV